METETGSNKRGYIRWYSKGSHYSLYFADEIRKGGAQGY